MMRGYFDRMLRPRDLVLQFRRVSDGPAADAGASGILATPQKLEPGDLERIRALDTRELVDGQIVKIRRQG